MYPTVRRQFAPAVTAFVLALAAAGCQEDPVAVDASGSESAGAEEQAAKRPTLPFADAEVFFEFNSTDDDLGFQLFLDADGWDHVKVEAPGGNPIIQFKATGELARLGITELRFESAEPSPSEVLALFSPGDYLFSGTAVEGGKLISTAELSSELPAAPTFSPSGGEVVDPTNTVVTWDAPGAEEVEVIISNEGTGASLDVIVPADVSSLDVPPQFLTPDTEYTIEILSIHENGNKTITEDSFVTE